MSSIDNVFLQVRAHLQDQSIKLWEAPYYEIGLGSNETAVNLLAKRFSTELNIDVSQCNCALNELQDHALRKLAARKEFSETGLASITVRCIDSSEGTSRILELKCMLTNLGADLQTQIAQKLELDDVNQVKCIAAGRIIISDKTLAEQGILNSQQLMAFVGRKNGTGSGNDEAVYKRIRNIKADVEAIVDSNQRLMEMEDQDGNPVFLPPNENRALLLGLGYCEKARPAIRRGHYDEALLLLLEADELFSKCNSKFLESVDNYALLNLDIVWCYLCLKNVTQLPDAQRRLDICERSFRRSYGENFERLIALKGNACAERALIVRLHLLQGVLLFHQNRRNEAYLRLMTASTTLRELRVDDEQLHMLVEMGYEERDARLALRTCSGNIERAVQFIHERKQKLKTARKQSEKERCVSRKMQQVVKSDNANEDDWVNPRSVCTLIDMGFNRALVVEALRRTKNAVPEALDLLQTQTAELTASLPPNPEADDNILQQLQQLGFDEKMARTALETTQNNLDRSIDFLVKLFDSEDKLSDELQRLNKLGGHAATDDNCPSTSTGNNQAVSQLIGQIMSRAKEEIESYKAYERFNQDIERHEQDYLDLPLLQEEQILNEYRRLLE